jgi:hypothetical protein
VQVLAPVTGFYFVNGSDAFVYLLLAGNGHFLQQNTGNAEQGPPLARHCTCVMGAP